MKKLPILLILLLFLGLAGCRKANFSVSQSIFNKPSSIQLLWKSTSDTAQYRRIGSQGLLEIAVNEVLKGGLPAQLNTLELSSLIDDFYFKEQTHRFEKLGFSTSTQNEPFELIEIKQSKSKEKKSASTFWADLSDYQKNNQDFLLLLDIHFFGTEQSFFSLIPTSAPIPTYEYTLTMIRTLDNEIVGHHYAKKTSQISGDWNKGPDYSLIMNSMVQLFESETNNAITKLLSGKKENKK